MRKVFVVLIPFLILMIALIQGNTLVWRLFALSALAIGISLAWIYWGKRRLSGRLKNHGLRYQAGHPIDIESVVYNNSLLPRPFLKLQIASKLPISNNNVVVNLPSRGSYYWHTQVLQPQRGRYKLGPFIAEISDPFGLLHIQHKLDSEQEILVYPKTVDLPSFWVSSNISSGIGDNAWFNRGTGSVIFGIREYVPGDSLNHIHWPSTAHTGKLIVKEFDSDLAKKVWVILDLNRESLVGKEKETTEEYAVSIAASILKKYADTGCQVGLISQTEDYHFFQARPGHPNMWRIQEALAVFRSTGKMPLGELINRAQGNFDGNSIAVIITSFINDGTLDAITHTQKRGIPVSLILLDAASFGGKPLTPECRRRLRGMAVPVYQVKKGDDVAETLNYQGKNLAVLAREG
jgi:uncharacterized protein (DUF58 family)